MRVLSNKIRLDNIPENIGKLIMFSVSLTVRSKRPRTKEAAGQGFIGGCASTHKIAVG